MDISEELVQTLIKKASAAKINSYAPYSNFRVGAAVLCDGDQIFVGANVENASYGLTICGERTAIFNAISNGAKQIRAVVVNTDVDKFKWCCGACCSVILEFGESVQVYSSKSDGTYEKKGIRDLVPFAFCASDLQEKKISGPTIMLSQ
mmetsp:Transcript_2387/g.3386  ORF Transcript_2387/g.3386 Transcript_2387/m.3386 type:complete len:149 (-) Transcript_2387:110-556(-)|eukprot:CAMPEP_0117020178 /NCGR_PEP_ID=MMETSP0472-20121206/15378_1 /TAXON_ID=693140 ORGANISM="Tiarina fusus, Strain LIS" /NCGR_SAMPLE_ID=MMETSP0472 /ASSEMBLY_ACC=CAM_ASM_000603 /LENGTH=148 /DNA_ID=CAMNT_0004725327 /DNA_START=1557 /DNA_END=2003 /DNA_ORIENTATION=+